MAYVHPTWQQRLEAWTAEDRRRAMAVTEGIDFYSNDYLGLARSQTLAERIAGAEQAYGAATHGSTGSRLLSGHSALAESVEKELAAWLQGPAALFFGSGYLANLAVLSTLPQKGDTILYDQYAHACLKEGARLSLADRFSFRHNDLDDLRKKARRAKGTLYLVVESVYSMDGDQAPLVELVAEAEALGAVLVVDEAHSTGLWGAQGAGLCVELGLADRVGVRVHTFGKAMGVHGAAVVGHPALREVLLNAARSFIYTTAPPPHQWLSLREAVRFLATEHAVRWPQLQQVIQQYQEATERVALPDGTQVLTSDSPIQGLVVPGNGAARAAAGALQTAGFAVRPILSPTVPAGTERIRVCLHTYNTPEQLSALATTFAAL